VSLLAAVLAAAGCGSSEPRPPCAAAQGSLRTACGFRNPEDVEYVSRAGLVIVSNMRDRGFAASRASRDGDEALAHGGFLAGYDPVSAELATLWPVASQASAEPDPTLGDPACAEPPPAETFSPHGITSLATSDRTLLFVVNHASGGLGRESVEVFELRHGGAGPALVWKACIPTPEAIQANDVAAGADGTIVVSNYQPTSSLRHVLKSQIFGSKSGDVLSWRRESGWRHVAGSSSALPNGVALSVDGSMLFYAESATGRLHRLPLDGGGGAISVEVGGNPDNLTWTEQGRLLLASHTAGLRRGACLLGRRPCETSWAVYEIDPLTLSVRKVFEHDGSELGAVASAAQIGDKLVLGSLFDDRIGLLALR
jgi:hypothetical protein